MSTPVKGSKLIDTNVSLALSIVNKACSDPTMKNLSKSIITKMISVGAKMQKQAIKYKKIREAQKAGGKKGAIVKAKRANKQIKGYTISHPLFGV